MKIFNNGSSFAYGKYPEYVARGLNAELENVAMPGYANRSIWRTTLEYDPKNYDLALIQLTSPSRTEFYGEYGWVEISAQLVMQNLLNIIKSFGDITMKTYITIKWVMLMKIWQ